MMVSSRNVRLYSAEERKIASVMQLIVVLVELISLFPQTLCRGQG
jgi:hypothetical protein